MTPKCLRRYESAAVHPHQEMPQCGRIAASSNFISQESVPNAERDFRHRDALLLKPMTESDHEPCLAQETLVRVSLLIESSRIRPQDRTQRAYDRSERYLALPAAHRAIRTRSASPIFCGRLCRTRHAVNACKSRVFAALYGVSLHSPHCGIVLRSPAAVPPEPDLSARRDRSGSLHARRLGGLSERAPRSSRNGDQGLRLQGRQDPRRRYSGARTLSWQRNDEAGSLMGLRS
jgi:hypothetical protein